VVGGADSSAVRGFSNEETFAVSRPTSRVTAGGNQLSSGVFIQDLFRVSSRVLLTLDGRYDHWSNYDAHSQTVPLVSSVRPSFTAFPDVDKQAFSPRAALLFAAGPHLSLTASVYKSFRAPTLNELYRSFRVGNTVTLANSLLTAERLSGAESGANLFFGRTRMHAAFFWMQVSDPIANVTLSTTPTLITSQRQNLGRTRSRGVEVDGEWHASRLDVSAGYQFVDAVGYQLCRESSLGGTGGTAGSSTSIYLANELEGEQGLDRSASEQNRKQPV
jgi:outer membrane receptor protein involved in Fe transport